VPKPLQLLSLEEKSTATKLDMLYQKSLYVVALNLAKTQNLDDASVADIHKQYGDHYYSKGDYDSAMQQYIQTIGFVQPSYVVRKASIPLLPSYHDPDRVYSF
jgi:vacuolar protein sorting-associated protein 11